MHQEVDGISATSRPVLTFSRYSLAYLKVHLTHRHSHYITQPYCSQDLNGLFLVMVSRASRTAVPCGPDITSFMYSLPVRRLKEVLNQVLPDKALGPVEDLPSTQLSRLYTLKMSDESKLLLSFAPSLAVRLLRHESTMLSSEATLVNFITELCRRQDTETVESDKSGPRSPRSFLYGLVPRLLKHSSNNREMAYPYSIFEANSGVPLSTLSIYLTIPERREIERQLGSMVRSLASLTSPSGTFGTIGWVLPNPYNTTTTTAPETRGSASWSEAFGLLLEGVLRDGEDMSVLVPYQTLRNHYRRLSWHLDAVTSPRLLILDAGNETNMLIERGSEEEVGTVLGENCRLVGLRSWSQGVFGDPLLSNCFENPSETFLEGWRGGTNDIIEDSENADIRLLIYSCFRAVVMIVTEYYRPQGDSSRRELEGRRLLTSALAALDKIEIVTVKRQRSHSNESASIDSDGTKRQRVMKIEQAE